MAISPVTETISDSEPIKMNSTMTDIRQMPFYKVVEEIEGYAILLLDKEGNIQNWNKGAAKMQGYTPEEIIGKNFRLFYTEHDIRNKKPELLIRKALERGKIYDEGWRVRKDQSQFWGSVTIITLYDNNGDSIGFLKFTRDLTKKKQAESDLAERLREIEAKNKELEQFAYIASHDLQEPLRTVMSIVGLFRQQYEGKLGEPADTYLKFLLESTERMRNLIKGLLDYSRIGQNKELAEVDTGAVVKEVLADLDAVIKESHASIEVTELPVLNVYKTEIRLLFQNLLSNAIKFRKPDVTPVIHIGAKKQTDDSWLFSVTDNGIGIESKFTDRIFMIFQRLNARTQYEGTGIGLSHCRKIVELHGGKIWVESVPHEGSTFYFTILSLTQ